MKILLSAYACEPNKGSEPGVGWNWARNLARMGHQVHLITRANNRESVEAAIEAEGLPLSVLFYDLPKWARWWKRGERGIRLYYILWQYKIYRLAKTLHNFQKFDVIHHITFGVFREPSFLAFCGAPFIFGPVGGGEEAPPALLASLHSALKAKERLRIFANRIAPLNPVLRKMYRRTNLVLCKTYETERLIENLGCRIVTQPEIGCEPLCSTPSDISRAPGRLRLLYVGRLLGWKGVHLAIQSFAEIRLELPDASFTIVGRGRDERWIRNIAARHGVLNSIDWIPWLPKGELQSVYERHNLFVFPSLHDSSGNVVLEALSCGLPVICLDVGGPPLIAGQGCGAIVSTKNKTERAVVHAIAEEILSIASSEETWQRCSDAARRRAAELSWENVVRNAYLEIERTIDAESARTPITM